MSLLFEEKVRENREAFANKVRTISRRFGVNPNALMVVMNAESGLNHRAVNPNGGATGLIQFMPATASGLGTSTSALRNMSNLEQLDWVERYYEPHYRKWKPTKDIVQNATDIYLATFFPIAQGKPDSFVMEAKGLTASTVARANPIIDLNKDGKITVGEFKKYVRGKIPEDVLKQYSSVFNLIANLGAQKIALIAGAVSVIVILSVLLIRSRSHTNT